uniref:Uncharacterized protein n=1 Tax=viral metagenome TaxID=1070528 RepID=A0A6C0K591_9ZZZZ
MEDVDVKSGPITIITGIYALNLYHFHLVFFQQRLFAENRIFSLIMILIFIFFIIAALFVIALPDTTSEDTTWWTLFGIIIPAVNLYLYRKLYLYEYQQNVMKYQQRRHVGHFGPSWWI